MVQKKLIWTDKEEELFSAIAGGHLLTTKNAILAIKSAIQAGANVNAEHSSSKTPLIFACFCPIVNFAVKILLDNGADVNAKTRGLETALMFACDNPDIEPETIQLLLDNGADVNAKDYDGMTALMQVCRNRHVKPEKLNKIITLLLDKGASANAKNRSDNTPLMYACDNAHTKLETIQLLLNRGGAEVNAVNSVNRTPLAFALDNAKLDPQVIKLLVVNGAQLNEPQLARVMKKLTKANADKKQTKQKLSEAEQEIANLTQQVDKLETQQAWNKFQDKKREQKRMRDLLLGKYRTK
jgi:ankyrin repeat protein